MTQTALSRSRSQESGPSEIIRRLTELFPAQDGAATRIALALYRQLARKDRVSVECIAAAAGVSGDQVADQLAAWPAVYRDNEGAVIGFWGLTASPMPHRFTVAGRERFTWCAWDALFIPELIGEPAEVQSITPVDAREVRLGAGSSANDSPEQDRHRLSEPARNQSVRASHEIADAPH